MKKNYERGIYLFLAVIFLIFLEFFYDSGKTQDYSKVLDEMCEKDVTFTESDILNKIKNLNPSENDSSKILSTILDKSKCVEKNKDGEKLYTTLKYQRLEKAVLNKFRKILRSTSKIVCDFKNIKTILNLYPYLNHEQNLAVSGICNSKSNVNILIGRAGSGKTTTLKAISEIYKKQGFKSIGMSLSSLAAQNLEKVTGIECHSIDYWVYHKWVKKNEQKINDINIMIIDEAGMIGTAHWKKILNAAERFKLKIIIVGDCDQFKPISAGDCFRLFINEKEAPCFELKTIIRQKIDWMRKASLELSQLNIASALNIYRDKGKINETNDINSVVPKKYIDFEKSGNTIVLCYTKKECDEINKKIRSLKKNKNDLESDFLDINGKKFSKNEKIIFLKNNKDFDVKNGQIGFIKNYENKILNVEIESETKNINIDDYDKIDYAYAITLHKSQGKTFDNVIVIGSPKMDSKALYVAMTRHSQDIELFYQKSDFSTFDKFVKTVSKYNHKDSLEDFKNQD